MLAVSPLPNTSKDENQGEMASTFAIDTHEFPDFSDTNLLDSIDFDDLFAGINDSDVLPDLEMDPEILAEFSAGGGDQESEMKASASVEKVEENNFKKEEEDRVSSCGSGAASASASGSNFSKEEEIVSKREEPVSASLKTLAKDGDKGRSKSSTQTKNNNNNNNQGKRKMKVINLSFSLSTMERSYNQQESPEQFWFYC